MYINRTDALKLLGKLSREPRYQHSGEDYYVGVAEAAGEIYSMPGIEAKITTCEILKKIIERIESEVLETFSDSGDDWFAAGKVNKVIDIIKEYMSS